MQIRRTLTFFDEVAIEAEQQVSQPLRKAWISSFTKRAAPGATIDIPLARKDALYIRSHYDGITVTCPTRRCRTKSRSFARTPNAAARTTASADSR
jgi:hypothetical protein